MPVSGEASAELEEPEPEEPTERGVVRHEGRSDRVDVLRRATLSFDGRASGSPEVVVVAQGIPVDDWQEGALIVLVHDKSPWRASGALTVRVENEALAPEDPAVAWVDTSRSVADAGPFTDLTTPPTMQTVALDPPFGPWLRVSLRWLQGATPATGAQSIALSVLLVGRRVP